jgi:hypothetical protein
MGGLGQPPPICDTQPIEVNVTDQISHPYKTTGKIIILHTSICTFLERRQNTKDYEAKSSKHSPN